MLLVSSLYERGCLVRPTTALYLAALLFRSYLTQLVTGTLLLVHEIHLLDGSLIRQ